MIEGHPPGLGPSRAGLTYGAQVARIRIKVGGVWGVVVVMGIGVIE
jgi:hypothetical protein